MADFYVIYPRVQTTVISVSGETKSMGQEIRGVGRLLGMTGKAKAGAVRCDRTIKIQPSVCSQFGGHRGGYAFGQRCPAKHRMFCHRLRSEEHTSELQSLMRISYAVFCLKKKNKKHTSHHKHPYKQQQLSHHDRTPRQPHSNESPLTCRSSLQTQP